MSDSEAKDARPESAEPRPRVLTLGVVGAVSLWLAQPPVAWWPLAWVAPALWLVLADSPHRFGRREYLRVWLAGSLYWLLAVHWVRLPHPLTPIGWVCLAMYLGCYPLTFVAAVRAARRARVPLWIAGPIAWTGLELLQARLFSGFLMGAISHSQAGQPWIRAVAAYAGAYGVTFLVVLVAATLAAAHTHGWRLSRLAGVAAALGLAMGLGEAARQTTRVDAALAPRATVALIQGDTRATWDPAPDRSLRIMERQRALSVQAVAEADAAGERVDLIVWPESMFRSPLVTVQTPQLAQDPSVAPANAQTDDWFRSLAGLLRTPLLMGADRFDVRSGGDGEPEYDVYNSAALVDATGELLATYDKTHLVPFGEYIPLAEGLPGLYYLTPMPGGMHAGDGPVSMAVPLADGEVLRVCPSICYETVVPHLPRKQVAQLAARGERPDVLVNVTNDAWFWGSSELDMHLACGVFRAIETGTPLLIAANGGLSAVVNATGDVVRVSPRMTEHVILAQVPPARDGLTPYTIGGDWFAGACLAATLSFMATRAIRGRVGTTGKARNG